MMDKSLYPLKGITVLVTRSQDQLADAKRLFNEKGAIVCELPVLKIGPPSSWEPLDKALANWESFNWFVFSSSNAVKFVEERLNQFGKSLSQRPKDLKFATVGKKTEANLSLLGPEVDFVPPNFVADSLIEHFPTSKPGQKILLPRVQSGGRTLLPQAFSQMGFEVIEVAAYESYCPLSIPKETIKAIYKQEIDFIAFTSSKTVVNTHNLLVKTFGADWEEYFNKVKLLSIGPQTSKSCLEIFKRLDKQAQIYDLNGLVKACIDSVCS